MTTETLCHTEDKSRSLARIGRMMGLLQGIEQGIYEDLSDERAEDAYKLLREARELAQEMAR